MTVVLGIDAAWTETEPSGVAVVSTFGDAWVCNAVAPSYETFLQVARGEAIDWSMPIQGGAPDVDRLLAAAASLAGADVDVVAVDIPIATIPVTTRRIADRVTSREFGDRQCSTHSPNAERPGKIGVALSTGFLSRGYRIATAFAEALGPLQLVEVYPHPALLSLLNRPSRVAYKVSKSSRYWPGMTVDERIALLLAEFRSIEFELRRVFGSFDMLLPSVGSVSCLSHLKRYEDALDALVCCWVGILYAGGQATALGDETAAIWCPTNVIRSDRRDR